MSDLVDINDRLNAAADKAENGAQIIHDVANGDENLEVQTESGPIPTLATVLKKLDQDLGGAVDQAIIENSSISSLPDKIPRGDNEGKIDIGWIPYSVSRNNNFLSYEDLRSNREDLVTAVVTGDYIYGRFRNIGKAQGYIDNGGTVIVAENGDVWLRINADRVQAGWFGLTYSGQDETEAVQRACNASMCVYFGRGTFKFGTVKIRQGSKCYGLSRTDTIAQVTGKGFVIVDGGIKTTSEITDITMMPIGVGIQSGICSELTDFFKLNSVEIHRVDFKGPDSDAAGYGLRTPNNYFARNIDSRNMTKLSLVDVNVTGGYKVEQDPAAQADTFALYTDGTSIGIYMDNFNVRSVKNVWRFGDNVEGYFIDNCEWVYVNTGIYSDTTVSKPGGWIGKLHINCALKGIHLKNRNVFDMAGVSVLRASFYYPQPTWDGVILENCSRFKISRLVERPDFTNHSGVKKGLSVIGCTGGEIDTGHFPYMTQGISVSGSTRFKIGTPEFESCANNITISADSVGTKIGDFTSNNGRRVSNLSPTTRFSLLSGFYSVDSQVETISVAGSETWQQSISKRTRRLRFGQGSSGAYTYNIALSSIGCEEGDTCKYSIRMDGSNPTLNFTSEGATMQTLNSSQPGSYLLEFEFTGSVWRCVLASSSSHS